MCTLHSPTDLTDVQLLEAIVGGPGARERARELLEGLGGIAGVSRAAEPELREVLGAPATASRLSAAFELGRRALAPPDADARRIVTASLLVSAAGVGVLGAAGTFTACSPPEELEGPGVVAPGPFCWLAPRASHDRAL